MAMGKLEHLRKTRAIIYFSYMQSLCIKNDACPQLSPFPCVMKYWFISWCLNSSSRQACFYNQCFQNALYNLSNVEEKIGKKCECDGAEKIWKYRELICKLLALKNAQILMLLILIALYKVLTFYQSNCEGLEDPF